jgi:hypothetical protein
MELPLIWEVIGFNNVCFGDSGPDFQAACRNIDSKLFGGT